MSDSMTPPPELVQQWREEAVNNPTEAFTQTVAIRAAQWGADQELEACCKVLEDELSCFVSADLRTARRPKLPSLKKQALEALSRFDWNSHTTASEMDADFKAIRRALEALPND